MAPTNAQRQSALIALFATVDVASLSPIPSGTPLASLLPGVPAATMLSALITALGTNFDTQVNTVLTNLIAILNTELTAANATVTSLTNQIAAL
jgi:hypothetical protein